MGGVDVPDRPRHPQPPFPLESQQSTRGCGGMRRSGAMVDRVRQGRSPVTPEPERPGALF